MRYREHVIECRHQLGDRLRELREEQGLTQEQLGLMVGLHRTYVSRIEGGKSSVTFDNLVAFAEGLGITLSDMLQGVGERGMAEGPVPISFMRGPRSTNYHIVAMNEDDGE